MKAKTAAEQIYIESQCAEESTENTESGEKDGEREEFIAWYLRQEHELLFSLPCGGASTRRFIPDEGSYALVYGSEDPFQMDESIKPSFQQYGAYMQGILNQVQSWAIMHSIVASPAEKEVYQRRYERLQNNVFRAKLLKMVDRHRKTRDLDRREAIKARIGEINRKILLCHQVWHSYIFLPATTIR